MNNSNQSTTAKRNAGKSTGPKTRKGKERSRLNAMKHGLSGEATTFVELHKEAFDKRSKAWSELYVINNDLDRWTLEQIVIESLRISRCQDLTAIMNVELAKRLAESWELERCAAARAIADRLDKKPEKYAGDLQLTKQGCELMIEHWEALLRILRKRRDWTVEQKSLALDLLGIRKCLRDGYDILDLENADPDGKLFDHRERLVLEELDGIRKLIDETLGRNDARDREHAEKGRLFTVPKEIAIYNRYEKESYRRYLKLSSKLKRRVVQPVAKPKETKEPTEPGAAEPRRKAPARKRRPLTFEQQVLRVSEEPGPRSVAIKGNKEEVETAFQQLLAEGQFEGLSTELEFQTLLQARVDENRLAVAAPVPTATETVDAGPPDGSTR